MPPTPDPFEFGDELEAAARVCRHTWGLDCNLHLQKFLRGERGFRHAILRASVDSNDTTLPDSIIIKKSNLGSGHIEREWAALDFLNRHHQTAPLVANLIGGDGRLGLIILEDLGENEDRMLSRLLYEPDPETARTALIYIARAFGIMQSSAAAHLDEYRTIIESLPPSLDLDFHQRGRLFESLRQLPAILESQNVPTSPAALHELDAALHHLQHPEHWTTLVHGDYAPSNLIYLSKSARILDFEVATIGHALLDGAYARLRHLNALDAMRIPEPIQRDMEQAYRDALAVTMPHARDDSLFGPAITAACLAWTAITLSNLPRVLDEDKPRGPASYRQRIMASLDAFNATAREFEALPAISEALSDLRESLFILWPEDASKLDIFPAFQNHGK